MTVGEIRWSRSEDTAQKMIEYVPLPGNFAIIQLMHLSLIILEDFLCTYMFLFLQLFALFGAFSWQVARCTYMYLNLI